jgi:hypothetical protein
MTAPTTGNPEARITEDDFVAEQSDHDGEQDEEEESL